MTNKYFSGRIDMVAIKAYTDIDWFMFSLVLLEP